MTGHWYSEELLLPAENLPGARDLLGEIVQVCGGLHSGNDLFELPPEILNRIEITTLTNPVRDWDLGILEPGGDGAGRVARGAVLSSFFDFRSQYLWF